MGIRRMQGTSAHLTYLNTNEDKRSKYDCDYYDKAAQCCFRNKMIQACKGAGRCQFYKEIGLLQVTDYKQEASKKQQAIKKLLKEMEMAEDIKHIKHSNNVTGKIKLTKHQPLRLYDEIKLLNLNTKLMLDIRVVSHGEEDQTVGNVSVNSPLGKAVLQKRVSEVVDVKVGLVDERYRILQVKRLLVRE